jgi:hypothetical protein
MLAASAAEGTRSLTRLAQSDAPGKALSHRRDQKTQVKPRPSALSTTRVAGRRGAYRSAEGAPILPAANGGR